MPFTTIRLTLEVTFDTGKTPVGALMQNMQYIADHAASAGLMTNETDAEVVLWSSGVEEIPTPDGA